MALTVHDTSLPDLLARQIAAQPAATILRKKDRGIWKAVDWAELGRRVHAMAAALHAAGIGPGDVVGVLSEISPAFVAADLGILTAGGIALALYPSDTGEAVAHVLATSRCKLLFVEGEEQLDKVLHIRDVCPDLRRIVILDMKGLRDFADPLCESLAQFLARAGSFTAPALDANAIAVLAYTSGTTGQPKPVWLSHRNIMTQLAAGLTLTGLGPGDERLAFLPMALVTERIFGLYLALASGTISNLVESVETVPENLAEIRPTVLIAPPRVWQRLATGLATTAEAATTLQRAAFDWALRSGSTLARRLVLKPALASIGLDRLRCAWVGGAPVSPALIARFQALGVDLQEFYGLAESGGVVSFGSVIAGMELRIAEGGEIQIRGPQIAAEGWLATGDLGHFTDGRLHFEGRISERLTLRDGRMVMPTRIENELKLSPYISDVLVFGDGQDDLAGLIMVEQDVLERWAQTRDLPPGNFAALVQSDAVRTLLQAELDRLSHALPHRLRRFAVINRRLEPGDPELTPMLRLRRDVVARAHPDLLQALFAPG